MAILVSKGLNFFFKLASYVDYAVAKKANIFLGFLSLVSRPREQWSLVA